MTLDLMTLLSAVASAEGYFAPGNPLPHANNNPGDLDFAGQDGAVAAGRFAKFDSIGRGIAANLRQICMDIQRGQTLQQLVYTWAPPGDNNNSALYLSETIRRIAAAGGPTIDPSEPLWNYLVPQLVHIP